MHKDLKHFEIWIPENLGKEDKNKANKAIGVLYDFMLDYINDLAKKLKVSRDLVWKIYLLRGGKDYTEEKEKELIKSYKETEKVEMKEAKPIEKGK